MIINLKISSKRFIDTNFNKLEQYIIETNNDNEFIQNGIDINNFNGQYTEAKNEIDEIYQLIPTAEELGVNKLLCDLAIDLAKKSLNSKIDNVDTAVGVIQNLADENGVITISSFVNRLKYYANTGINKIILISSVIIVLIFLIYLVFCLVSIKYGRET
jgi:peroxiredoxin family protein